MADPVLDLAEVDTTNPGSGAYTTSAFTPTASTRYFCLTAFRDNAAIGAGVTVSGHSGFGTWSIVTDGTTTAEVEVTSGDSIRLVLFTAESVASPGSGSLTIDNPAGGLGCAWVVFSWADAADPFTVDQVVTANGNSSSGSVSLSSPTATDLTLAGWMSFSGPGVTPGSGLTEIGDTGTTGRELPALQAEFGYGDATLDATFAGTEVWAGIGIEIAKAATGHEVTVNETAETDAAQTVAKAKARAAGQPVEADLAQPAGRAKTKATGQPVEADTAQPVTAAKATTVEQASEADTAAAVGRAKAGPVAATVSAETAQPVAKAKTLPVAQAAETDSAQPVSRAGRTVTIAQAAETDVAQAATTAKAKPASQATETDTGRSVAAAKAAGVGQASASETAQPLTHTKTRQLGQATEADTARPVAQAGQTITVGRPVETDAAQPVGAAFTYQVSAAQGTEVALPITPVGGRPLTRGGGLWSVDDLLDDINRERLDEEDAVALVLALID